MRNIIYEIENLDKSQKSKLELAETLLERLNSISPKHIPKTVLDYNGKKFNVVRTGYLHDFVIKDINMAINGDLNKHKEFILEMLRKEFNDCDKMPQSDARQENRNVLLRTLMKYYNSEYPAYNEIDSFSEFIQLLNKSIEKEIRND